MSAEELFRLMQYLGRLYDHDPDEVKTMQNLHNILTDKDQNYDVDSMMKGVSPTAKPPSRSPYLQVSLLFSLLLLRATNPLPKFGFFILQNLTDFCDNFQEG
jgi:hypothetical protein